MNGRWAYRCLASLPTGQLLRLLLPPSLVSIGMQTSLCLCWWPWDFNCHILQVGSLKQCCSLFMHTNVSLCSWVLAHKRTRTNILMACPTPWMLQPTLIPLAAGRTQFSVSPWRMWGRGAARQWGVNELPAQNDIRGPEDGGSVPLRCSEQLASPYAGQGLCLADFLSLIPPAKWY